MYSAQILDHFEHPRHVGDVENATAAAQIDNPACGDVLRLSVRVVGGVITEACFRAKGCVPSMACGSKLTEMVTGRPLADARKLTRKELADALGGMPAGSDHAPQLAIEALQAVLKQVHR
ncbi:MAG TPA: iron-sulfur cluster assembly scaffold protein [Terriglobales bacterium]|nr:iron-sulfur cluster assembly scaffold protein [Terriglobales bacterium]